MIKTESTKLAPLYHFFNIISHNETNDEHEIEMLIVLDNLMILLYWDEDLFVCPRILKVGWDKIIKATWLKYRFDLTIAAICSQENSIFLYKISTINWYENPISK